MEVGGQRHAPAALPPGKTRYRLNGRLGGLKGCSRRVRKISPPHRIRFPNRPAPSESLYRLSYPGSVTHIVQYLNFRGYLSSRLYFYSYKMIRFFFCGAAAQRS